MRPMELRVKGDMLIDSHTEVTTTVFRDRPRIRTRMTMELAIIILIIGERLRMGMWKRKSV